MTKIILAFIGKGKMKVISEYFDFKMLEWFEKAAAKSNEIDERLKHCPRATKYSTPKFYNFNKKRKKEKLK